MAVEVSWRNVSVWTVSIAFVIFLIFFKSAYPETEFHDIIEFQRYLVRGLADELSSVSTSLGKQAASLVEWITARFEVQNIKLILRAIKTKSSIEDLRKHLISFKGEFVSKVRVGPTQMSIVDLLRIIPKGPLRKSLESIYNLYSESASTFIYETALDCSYFRELSLRTSRLHAGERQVVQPVIDQQIDTFLLMLALRGKYHLQVSPHTLLQFHVEGSRISRARLSTLISDPDARTSVTRAIGWVIDQSSVRFLDDVPDDSIIPTAEHLAWKRFLRLSNKAFRESHMGLGAIVGYAGVRIIEIANLISISEAIRLNLPVESIRKLLITPDTMEAGRV